MLLFFLIIFFTWLVQLFLPWWSMMLVTVILSFTIGRSWKEVFFAGFFGCGMVWLIYAIYITITKGDLMTLRMVNLFSLPASWALYLVSFLVAAIAGVISAWMGFSLKAVLKPTGRLT